MNIGRIGNSPSFNGAFRIHYDEYDRGRFAKIKNEIKDLSNFHTYGDNHFYYFSKCHSKDLEMIKMLNEMGVKYLYSSVTNIDGSLEDNIRKYFA